MIRRLLRRFRRWWFVLKNGCEFCGVRAGLKFYDFGRVCPGCYRIWLLENDDKKWERLLATVRAR